MDDLCDCDPPGLAAAGRAPGILVTMDDAPELSVREGYAPPSGLPTGSCITTALADGTFRIDHADPRVLISAELIDDITDHPTENAFVDLTGCETFIGGLLKISGVNRTVIYRLTDWIPAIRSFVGEWPD